MVKDKEPENRPEEDNTSETEEKDDNENEWEEILDQFKQDSMETEECLRSLDEVTMAQEREALMKNSDKELICPLPDLGREIDEPDRGIKVNEIQIPLSSAREASKVEETNVEMLWRRPIIKWQLRSVKENSEEDHKEGPKDKEDLKVSHKEGQKEGQKEDPKDKEEGMKNTQSQDLKVKPTDVIFVTMGSTLYKTTTPSSIKTIYFCVQTVKIRQ